MLLAAERKHARLVASIADEADVHAHRVRARADTEAAEFKRLADDDIDEIHARAATEIERIRTRTDRRVAARRGRLDRHLVGHASIIDSEIASVNAAVEGYGRELDGFFGRLRGQREPGEIARLAVELPATPDFEAGRAEARAAAVARVSGQSVTTEAYPEDVPAQTADQTEAPGPTADGAAGINTDEAPSLTSDAVPDSGVDEALDITADAVPDIGVDEALGIAADETPVGDLVAVMDPDATRPASQAWNLARVMRTLASWTSSGGRGS